MNTTAEQPRRASPLHPITFRIVIGQIPFAYAGIASRYDVQLKSSFTCILSYYNLHNRERGSCYPHRVSIQIVTIGRVRWRTRPRLQRPLSPHLQSIKNDPMQRSRRRARETRRLTRRANQRRPESSCNIATACSSHEYTHRVIAAPHPRLKMQEPPWSRRTWRTRQRFDFGKARRPAR